MLIRSNHEMTAGVWIPIQDDEIVLCAIDDQHLFVVAGPRCLAEQAAFGVALLRYICGAPGRPQVIHRESASAGERSRPRRAPVSRPLAPLRVRLHAPSDLLSRA